MARYDEMEKRFETRKTVTVTAGGYMLVFEELPGEGVHGLRLVIATPGAGDEMEAELFFTADEWEDFRDVIDETRFRVTVAKPKREALADSLPKDAPAPLHEEPVAPGMLGAGIPQPKRNG